MFFFLTEVHNQYDGIMVPKPGEKYFNIFGSFKVDKYEEDLVNDITFAVKYFFPKWKGFMLGKSFPSISCKESLQCVDLIFRGFWLTYGEKLNYWKHDSTRFKGFLGKVL